MTPFSSIQYSVVDILHRWNATLYGRITLYESLEYIRAWIVRGRLLAARLGVSRGARRLRSDNGGITLPAGFCALVAADGLGAARHIVVAPNGDVYVALQSGRTSPGGVVALRYTKGDGHFDMKETFGDGSSTGIGLRNGYLYVAKTHSVERYKMTPGELKPAGPAEVVVTGLPGEREHGDKGVAFDGKGSLLRQRRRAFERLPGEGSAAEVAGPGSLPHSGKAWRHLEVRRKQAGTDAG